MTTKVPSRKHGSSWIGARSSFGSIGFTGVGACFLAGLYVVTSCRISRPSPRPNDTEALPHGTETVSFPSGGRNQSRHICHSSTQVSTRFICIVPLHRATRPILGLKETWTLPLKPT